MYLAGHIFTKGLPETGAHRMVINSVDSSFFLKTNFPRGNGSSWVHINVGTFSSQRLAKIAELDSAT